MMLEVLPVVIARGQWTGVTNIVARMERSAIRDSRDAGPGLCGACHRARHSRDPLAPSELQAA